MGSSGDLRSMEHLTNLILTRNAGIPNFALLLGSGASATSGVKTASEMISVWRSEMYRRSGSRQAFLTWIKKQDWYGSDDEYAFLFESLYDQPAQRRAYIEERLKNAHPSWGYVYLANLLKANIFNVVFTTNFDDLLNEACFLYLDGLRPIVCAHDSAVSGIRVTPARPKIIKLHGDFLFDNIKNTVSELTTLEENMRKKFMQFAQEYGLIVVGYGGRDRSVMDILDVLIRSNEFFGHGVYWCVRKGELPCKRLSAFIRKSRVYCTEIEGFDEFMALIHDSSGLDLPTPIAQPISAARDRTRLFVDIPPEIKSNPIIARDINRVLEGVSGSILESKEPDDHVVFTIPKDDFPPSIRAVVARHRRDLEGALAYLMKAHQDDPNDFAINYEIAETLAKLDRKAELKAWVDQNLLDPDDSANITYYLLHADDNDGVIRKADEVLALHPTDKLVRINRAIALKRLGKKKELNKELRNIEVGKYGDHIRAGIAALRKQKKVMLAALRKALEKKLLTPSDVEMFVVFEDYWDDPDLQALVDEWRLPEEDAD